MKTSIYDLIYDIVRHIPKGRVTSYGAIAQSIGTGGSARLVGWAMNAAANLHDVPAHRVVNSKGLLTGKHHFGGDTMQRLLEAEGILIKDDQVQDFDKVFWHPNELID
ncbi:MGMT family protein [Taibaiella lutea]|uniref:MGMT family protein n=1 Tax=Taibaiella lutea TaxID=2608001 RepID=A0A5M6CIS2_9BACT|nr:MGMT family protein [Taibaiella lutea]KAA5534917.1 MGMT family protein [Taibaiella lutea]